MDNLKINKRVEWIDFLKGFGMLLVILGHCNIPNPYWKIIYMFHMPLFFMISGYVYSPNKNKVDNISYTKSIIKKYLIPYFIFSLIGLFITLILPQIYEIILSYKQIQKFLIGIFIGRGQESWTGQWGAIWYLIATFNLLFIVHAINRTGLRFFQVLAFVLGPIVSWLGIHFVRWTFGYGWLPWNFGASLMAIPFFYIGNLYREFSKRIIEFFQNKFVMIGKLVLLIFNVIILVIGGMIGYSNNGIVAFTNNSYGNIVLMFIGAGSISIGLFFIFEILYSLNIKNNRIIKSTLNFIEWIGNNSLFLLGLHGMTIPLARNILQSYSISIINNNLWIFVFLFCLFINIFIVLFYKKIKQLKNNDYYRTKD